MDQLRVLNHSDMKSPNESVELAILYDNFHRQFEFPNFGKVHNLSENAHFPVWDANQPGQPNLVLGPMQGDPKTIARVIYGIPPQIMEHHGYDWDVSDLRAQGFDEDFANAVVATEELGSFEASPRQIANMRRWATFHNTGVQYVPAGLSPHLNAAAENGADWADITKASKAITAAGAAVMLSREHLEVGPEMVNGGKPVKVACEEHFQDGIKRPPNSWILYRRDLHAHVLKMFPGMKNTDISKVIAHMWKREPEHIKKYYYKYASDINRAFRENFPKYKFSPRKPGERKRRASRGSSTTDQSTLRAAANQAYGVLTLTGNGESSSTQASVLASLNSQELEDLRNFVLSEGQMVAGLDQLQV